MDSQLQVVGPAPAPAVPESPINAVAIRESSFGQYLESINTGGTWISTVQEVLGLPEVKVSALDVFYMASGALGFGLLLVAPVSAPVIIGSSALVAISAVGLTEEERRTKIEAGIAGGALVIWQPQMVFVAAKTVAKEAYVATKETVKETVELAKTGIGMTTTALGFGTSALATYVIVKKRRPNKRKRVS